MGSRVPGGHDFRPGRTYRVMELAEACLTPAAIIETDIPARLDRLPWTRFHTLVVVALGITWVLDGLEVTVAGSIAGALQESPVLHFTAAEVGLVGSAYLVGAVTGAVLFGYLTDRFGRKQLFMVTLGHLPDGDGGDRIVLGFLELRRVPRSDRRRHRRRVHGDQLGDPGTDTGALSRPHRSRDQRQLLARRGIGRRRRHRLSAARASCRRIGAGAPPSASARSSGWSSWACGSSFRKARAG